MNLAALMKQGVKERIPEKLWDLVFTRQNFNSNMHLLTAVHL